MLGWDPIAGIARHGSYLYIWHGSDSAALRLYFLVWESWGSVSKMNYRHTFSNYRHTFLNFRHTLTHGNLMTQGVLQARDQCVPQRPPLASRIHGRFFSQITPLHDCRTFHNDGDLNRRALPRLRILDTAVSENHSRGYF